jgi:glycosyltransferase involved in cell wall biosynthesis
MKSALVITPTTGAPELVDAVKSVQEQTYKNVKHLVVVDGDQFASATEETLSSLLSQPIRCVLPFNTGGGGFYGHRIMAAFPHLVNFDYVLFLDQDNWYDPEHVESLVEECERYKFEWSYSLRKVYDKDKKYICDDNCESLGRWPVWVSTPEKQGHLIDSSSYCFSMNFIRLTGHLWDFGWGADRRYYTIVKDEMRHKNYGCTSKHTLNYRLGGNEGSVQAEFFIEGNKKMLEQYQSLEHMPWHVNIS